MTSVILITVSLFCFIITRCGDGLNTGYDYTNTKGAERNKSEKLRSRGGGDVPRGWGRPPNFTNIQFRVSAYSEALAFFRLAVKVQYK